MKKIFGAVVLVTVLTGCAAIDKVTSLWPRDHDPALATTYINLQLSLETVNCADKSTFNQSLLVSDWLNRYATFRKDPQMVTTEAILSNLKKAVESGEVACKRYVNLANINMKTLNESWSKR